MDTLTRPGRGQGHEQGHAAQWQRGTVLEGPAIGLARVGSHPSQDATRTDSDQPARPLRRARERCTGQIGRSHAPNVGHAPARRGTIAFGLTPARTAPLSWRHTSGPVRRGRSRTASFRTRRSSHARAALWPDCSCPKAAVRAMSAMLLLLCLLFRSSWLTAEGGRQAAASPGRAGSRGRVGRRGWWRSIREVSRSPRSSHEIAPFSPQGQSETWAGNACRWSIRCGSVVSRLRPGWLSLGRSLLRVLPQRAWCEPRCPRGVRRLAVRRPSSR